MRNLNHCWPRVTWKQHRLPVEIGISLRHHRLSAAGDEHKNRGMVGMVWGSTFNRWIIHQLIMMYTYICIYIDDIGLFHLKISADELKKMLIPVRWMHLKTRQV